MGGRRQAIVDGTPAPDEDAVVLVKVVGGIGLCTGTFVSPSVVLTAKHCVQSEGMAEPFPTSLLSVGVGPRLGETVDYRVRRVDTTPGAYGGGLSGLLGQDIATITIRPDRDGELPDVVPLSVRREPPDELVGQEVTFVGYGQQPDGTTGVKMKTTGTLSAVVGNVLRSRSNICQGDSGGPMILEGDPRQIVGVASFGRSATAGACPASEDGHNRVDVWIGIVDEALLEAGDCPIVEEEACDSVDNDCDGRIDETCKGLGEPCGADDECAYAQLPERFGHGLRGLLDDPVVCGETPLGRVCTRPCDPLEPATACRDLPHPFRRGERLPTPGAYCMRTEGCAGTCVAGARGPAAVGEPCARDTECATLACVDPGDGQARCVVPCQGGAGVCPTEDVCAAPTDACGACLAPDLVAGARGLGEPCAEDLDCGSGRCLDDDGQRYCTRGCEGFGSCPEGFHCRGDVCARGRPGRGGDACLSDLDCRGDLVCHGGLCAARCTDTCDDGFRCEAGFCEPELAPLGTSCGAATDCLDGRCEPLGEGDEAVCTRPCGAAGSCPVGFVCVERGGELLCARPAAPTTSGSGGGCAATPAPGGPLGLWLLALIAWRRRSR